MVDIMFNLLDKLFNKASHHAATKGALSREEIIEMLKTSPEKLDAFEAYYKTQVLPNLPITDNLFTCNAKQVAEETANPELSNEYVDSLDSMYRITSSRHTALYYRAV